MKKLLVVYHSQSGSTRCLAEAVAQGARAEAGDSMQEGAKNSSPKTIEVILLPAMEADSNDLIHCDGVIFGSPENLGYLSGGLKDFFDRTFYPAEPHQLNKPYAVFISAGNDGTGALRQLQRIVKGYPLKPVAEPVIVRGEVTQEGLNRCRELGMAMAAGLSMGIF